MLLFIPLFLGAFSPTVSATYDFSNAQLNATNLTTLQLVDILFSNYSSKLRPGIDGGAPTKIGFNIFINALSSVNEITMDVTLDIFLRQEWMDERFAFPAKYKTIILNPWDAKKLWTPDVYFPFERDAKTHSITIPNILVRIHPNGKIFFSQRYSIRNVCNMMMKYFPFDSQSCRIDLESYAFTTSDLVFLWTNKPYVQMRKNITLPEFIPIENSLTTGNCTADYTTGSYPCIFITFGLQRQIGYYLIQTFVPSILIVVLSWVSFWIDIRAVPARISLGLLTVLTMTTQSSAIMARMPRVSYIKAIDVWMTVCLIFVFSALVEFSVVNVLARQDEKRKVEIEKKAKRYEMSSLRSVVEQEGPTTPLPNHESQQAMNNAKAKNNNSQPDASAFSVPNPDPSEPQPAVKMPNNALMADKLSRVCFPLVFIAFNLCYWLGYSLTSDLPRGNQ